MNYFGKYKSAIDEMFPLCKSSSKTVITSHHKQKLNANGPDTPNHTEELKGTELPPPVPLLPKQFHHEYEVVRHAFLMDVM